MGSGGIISPIGGAHISCGFVGRHVCKLRDVELSTDLVVDARRGTDKCMKYRLAQHNWQRMCEEYVKVVGPRVQRALLSWPDPGAPARRVTRGGGGWFSVTIILRRQSPTCTKY